MGEPSVFLVECHHKRFANTSFLACPFHLQGAAVIEIDEHINDNSQHLLHTLASSGGNYRFDFGVRTVAAPHATYTQWHERRPHYQCAKVCGCTFARKDSTTFNQWANKNMTRPVLYRHLFPDLRNELFPTGVCLARASLKPGRVHRSYLIELGKLYQPTDFPQPCGIVFNPFFVWFGS